MSFVRKRAVLLMRCFVKDAEKIVVERSEKIAMFIAQTIQ